jgi:hypothetical protein
MAQMGQRFPVASVEHSSCFQKVVQGTSIYFHHGCIINIVRESLTEVDMLLDARSSKLKRSLLSSTICGYCAGPVILALSRATTPTVNRATFTVQ